MEENHGKLSVPPQGTNIAFPYLPSAGCGAGIRLPSFSLALHGSFGGNLSGWYGT